LKQRILAAYHYFYYSWQPNFIHFMLRSRNRNFGKVGVGVGHSASDSVTLVTKRCSLKIGGVSST